MLRFHNPYGSSNGIRQPLKHSWNLWAFQFVNVALLQLWCFVNSLFLVNVLLASCRGRWVTYGSSSSTAADLFHISAATTSPFYTELDQFSMAFAYMFGAKSTFLIDIIPKTIKVQWNMWLGAAILEDSLVPVSCATATHSFVIFWTLYWISVPATHAQEQISCLVTTLEINSDMWCSKWSTLKTDRLVSVHMLHCHLAVGVTRDCEYWPPTRNVTGNFFHGNSLKTTALAGIHACMLRWTMSPHSSRFVTLAQSRPPARPDRGFRETWTYSKAWSRCLLFSSWSGECSLWLQYLLSLPIQENASPLRPARSTSF